MKFFISNNFICTRVKLYGEDVRKTLELNGHTNSSIEEANYIFVNTCSFLESRENFHLNKIKELNDKLSKNQKICIIGCLPGTSAKKILNINKDIILFSRNLDEIESYFKLEEKIKCLSSELDESLKGKKKAIYYLNKIFLHDKHIDFRLKKNKVWHIQISVGCQGKCTYCSEKNITKLKSRNIDDIMEAFYDGLERGYKLFSLNSDDVSAFGKDNNENIDTLLKQILKIDKDFYLCIPEFNPNGLSSKVVELLKNKKVLYITIPIQSGSNKILNKMKRPYTIEDVTEKIKILRKNNKNLKINTHIIVGFPGETEEDFELTKKVLKEGYFDRLKIFNYSDRPDTESINMPNKINSETKNKRRKILRKIIIKDSIKKKSLSNVILNLEVI